MAFPVYHSRLCVPFRPEIQMFKSVYCGDRKEPGSLRRRVLRKVDNELRKGNTKLALTLIKQLQGKPGGLCGFGGAKQVPVRNYSLVELDLNGMDISSLQPLVNSVLETIERTLQLTALQSNLIRGPFKECRDRYGSAEIDMDLYTVTHSVMECNQASLGGLESLMHKRVETLLPEGRVENLMLDKTRDHFLIEDYHSMCMQHEAGHFLIAYLLGVLPKGYSVPSLESMRNDELVGGRVDFVGLEFLRSVIRTSPNEKIHSRKSTPRVNNSGQVSSKNLNRSSCVALGGLAAEYLSFGYSEGSFDDIERLEMLLKSLGYTEREMNNQIKWAVLNTVLILNRHHDARIKLAEAMALGRSIGFCINTIENALDGKEI